MAEQTLDLTEITVKSPFAKGQPVPWSFPPTCACCGAAGEYGLPERIMLDSGNRKRWYDVEVPYCETCYHHVAHRNAGHQGARRLAIFLGCLLGVGTFLAAWQLSGADFGHALEDKGNGIGAVVVGTIGFFIFEALLKRRSNTKGGDVLPRTETCTIAPQLELAEDKFRFITKESKMIVRCTCGSPVFAEHFAERNADLVLETRTMEGVTKRTPRGDLVLKSKKPVGDPEPAA